MARRALLVLALLVACQVSTSPAYYVGDASYAIVVAKDGLPTQFYRVGEPFKIALPGESLCVHFQADGNWQKLVLWNATWPRLELQWIPHEAVRHVSLHFFGPDWRQTSTGERPC